MQDRMSEGDEIVESSIVGDIRRSSERRVEQGW